MDPYEETFRTWNKVATTYQGKFMDLELYNASYDFFCDRLPRGNATVLDVGCGPGNITKHLLSRRNDLQMTGIDVAPNMIALARKNNPAANFDVLDCRQLDQLSGRFDGIVCGFCLPYLSSSDSEKLIRDAAALLTDHGVLYLSFIEGDPAGSGFQTGTTGDRCYVYGHQQDTMTARLQANGFDLLRSWEIDYRPSPQRSETHVILTARKRPMRTH